MRGLPDETSWDLDALAGATRLGDWMFDQFSDDASGCIVEIGAGIGTFSERLLNRNPRELLLLEPDSRCTSVLESRFGTDPRVTVAAEGVPGSTALAALGPGTRDFVMCQNVLEHIDDDSGAVAEMAESLRKGGCLGLLVPAHPRLFGTLDEVYEHRRRYTANGVRALLGDAGLEVESLRAFNMLGIAGWWTSSLLRRSQIDPGSLRAYEALVRVWRPIEDRVRPRWGLSIVARGRKRA